MRRAILCIRKVDNIKEATRAQRILNLYVCIKANTAYYYALFFSLSLFITNSPQPECSFKKNFPTKKEKTCFRAAELFTNSTENN